MVDKRIKKTKLAIYKAFFDLLQNKSYCTITIKELMESANLTRKTFYLHYSTLDDVFREIISEQWKTIHAGMEEAGVIKNNLSIFFDYEDIDYVALFTYMNQVLKQRWNVIQKLAKDKQASQIIIHEVREYSNQLLHRYEQYYTLPTEILRLYVTNSISGFCTMYMEWFTSDNSVTVEEFADITKNIIAGTRKVLQALERR